MQIITRDDATDEELVQIEAFIHSYIMTLGDCLGSTEELGLSIPNEIKLILGLGVKRGALGKFENLKISNDEITFDVWLRVNFEDPGIFYKLNTTIDLVTKRAKVVDA